MKLFISYSHNDIARVKELAQHLYDGGHEVWYDHEIPTGQEWKKVLREKVTSADAFIYVLSRDSLKSMYCKREYRMVKDVKIAVFPILIDKNAEAEIPNDVKKLQYSDCSISFEMNKVLKLLRDLKAVENQLVAARARKEKIAEAQNRKNERGMASAKLEISISPLMVEMQGIRSQLVENLIEQVNEYLDTKQWEKAINKANELAKHDPHNSTIFSSRGWAYQSLGDKDKAIEEYNKAIQFDPQLALAYNNRGAIYGKKGENEKALADFNEAIRLSSQDAIAYNNRGNVYREKEEHEKSLADYNEAIRLDSNYALAYFNRGIAFYQLKEYKEALADFNETIRLNPQYTLAYRNRCRLFYQMNKIQEALHDAEKMCELSPKEYLGYNNQAFLLFQLEQYEEAQRSWQKAVLTEDVESLGFAGYAVVLEQLNQSFEAVKQYRKAINLDKRWKNDLEAIAKEFLWTDAMIGLARGILKRLK